jgi:outer membrane protein TolC
MLALDLPGLVGAGRGGAAKARATIEAQRARAELDAARFRTRNELGRALAELAVARALERELGALIETTSGERRRIELLERRQWLAPDQTAAAHSMLHHLDAARIDQRGQVAAARARLQSVSGLAADSPRLDDPAAAALELVERRIAVLDAGDATDAAALLERHPELALARLDYAASEADVRVACAERWPALLIGPKAVLTADDWMIGGLLRLALPWPPGAEAEVDAARAARDAARDRLIAALAATQARIAERREQEAAAEESLREHADLLLDTTARALRAAQARFAIDVAALPELAMAVDQRARALIATADARERRLVAAFDRAEALGPSTPTTEDAR